MVSNTVAALSSSTTNDYGSTDTIVESVRVVNDVDEVTKTKTNETKNDDDDDDENKNEMASLTSSYHTVNDTLYEGTSSSYEYPTHGGGSGVDDQETDWSRRRRVAISLSLYTNVVVLLTKVYAYLATSSLSVLAALIDSLLDVVSQVILQVAENHSSMNRRSSALYPAGAARLEPLGVLTCAAVMGVANFEVLRRSVAVLITHRGGGVDDGDDGDDNWSSVLGMATIVVVKSLLYVLCRRAMPANAAVADATLEALTQDHLNDCLSNAVAAVALVCLISSASLWYLDPLGAVAISFYVIAVWYATGREQIEQLTGKAAPADFIDELRDLARDFDERIVEVDVCRAYHFGPKFLVELELVLPRDTLLYESHDLGMELQYEIEGREEVERCFVHIDYETRPYDEHVVSKVPELRERYLENHRRTTGCHHSV